jgi:CBS domain-containing protein
MTTVADVMTRRVVLAREDTPFKELARLMHDHRVSGLPVLGEDGTLVGIVTEGDLLASTSGLPKTSVLLTWLVGRDRLEEIERRVDDLHAADVMMRNVITVGPETPLREAIAKLLEAGVKRLPVVDKSGRVLGIVSRRDLLESFLRSDEDIRREVREQVLRHTMWIDPEALTVTVRQGLVQLAGVVDRRSTKEILVRLVHGVEGVVGVEDHLTFEEDDRKDTDTGPLWGARLPGALRNR